MKTLSCFTLPDIPELPADWYSNCTVISRTDEQIAVFCQGHGVEVVFRVECSEDRRAELTNGIMSAFLDLVEKFKEAKSSGGAA